MSEPTPDDRLKAAQLAIERALSEHACTLVAVPKYNPDGRGGWYLTTYVQVVPK